MDSFSELVAIVGLFSTAFLAGLLWIFSACVMRALDSIEPAQSLAAMKIINTDIVSPLFVLIFLASAVAGVAALAVSSLPEDGWMMAAGIIHLVGMMAVTAVVHLPLNAGFDALDESPAAVAEWKTGARRWTRFNHVRAAAAALAATAYGIHLAM